MRLSLFGKNCRRNPVAWFCQVLSHQIAIEEIYNAFKDIGYDVTHRELMAADYGVPQKRRRLFFVAAKNLHYFQYPQPTHCETENLFGLPLYRGAGEALLKLPQAIIR